MPLRSRRCAASRKLLPLLLAALSCRAQDFTQRGFLETRFTAYPQTAPGDSGRLVAESLVRYEASYKRFTPWQFHGSVDARADSHRQTQREFGLSWQDRETRRPALEVRRLSAVYNRGPLTLELGKQFIRWGKTDVLIPTDRFAPRDYLGVVDNEFLGVTAARLTIEKKQNTLDMVWAPRFTPSRTPLLNQRWVTLPAEAPVRDLGARYPGGSQYGLRWNRAGAGYETSLSFYDGFNHLPLLDYRVRTAPLRVDAWRFYPRMRMYGGDAAVPLKFLTLKGEAAYFTSSTPRAGEYVLYVLQLERQAGEWFFVAGYAGQAITAQPAMAGFAPDRGLARALVGRAGYTIDTNRSVALESAVRQNGKGAWVKFEYSQASGQHWRFTASCSLIRGSPGDFLGQYRRNSHATLTARYSF